MLPIGTEKKTYPVFVPDVKKAVPFNYAGINAVGGTEAYRFVGNIPPTQNGTQTLPGSLVGQSAASVTLPQFFAAQITYWINPVTGALLNVTQKEQLTLRDSTGAQALLLFNANLVATTDSVDRLVAIDNNQVTKASFVNTLLPLVAGILGVILLVAGILLSRRPRDDVTAGPSGRSPELAAAEPAEDVGRSAATQASLVPGLDDESREAAPAEPAQAEEAQAEAGRGRKPPRPEAAKPEAAKPEAAEPEAAAESNAEANSEAPSAETEADTKAADTKAEAQAGVAQDEAPTAEIPAATTAEQAEAAGAPAGDASEAKPRRGGAHRR